MGKKENLNIKEKESTNAIFGIPFDSKKEERSVAFEIRRKHAYGNNQGLTVAEIYFATNKHEPNTSDDIKALNTLIANLNRLLKEGFSIELCCMGDADYRASVDYNLKLGMRRAEAVEKYIRNSINHKNFKISVISFGESFALQPKTNKKRPSLNKIAADRKVSVLFGDAGLRPPVYIATRGNWIFNKSIERNEINTEGKVVALKGTAAWASCEEEMNYMGTKSDPFFPVAIIHSNYSIRTINNQEEAFVKCIVYHQPSNRILFTASAHTDANKIIKAKYHYDKDHPNVKRKIYSNTVITQGRLIEEKVIPKWAVHSRAHYLFEPIYTELKGSYSNITNRIRATLQSG